MLLSKTKVTAGGLVAMLLTLAMTPFATTVQAADKNLQAEPKKGADAKEPRFVPIASYPSQDRASEMRIRELLDAAKIRFITVGSRGVTVNVVAENAKTARTVLTQAIKNGALSVQMLDQLAMPKAMRVVRKEDQLRLEEESSEEVTVPVAAGLIHGTDCEISIYRGKDRVVRSGGTYHPPFEFNRKASKIPLSGESYEVEFIMKWFETDAPIQPNWAPESGGKYKVLLTRKFKLSVGPENTKPAPLEKNKGGLDATGPFYVAANLQLGEGKGQTFDAKGVKIHYLVEGTGEPVVLIHGLNSSALINWKLTGVISELAKDHKVIALDLPGHGRSDRPMQKEAYGEQLVDDVVLLLDHLKIKKAHIVGYSLGGMVTVKLMTKHPDRVQSALVGGMGWLKEGSVQQKGLEMLGKSSKGKLAPPPAFMEAVGQLAVTEEQLKKIDLPVKVLVGVRDPVKQLYVTPLQKVRKDWPIIEITDAGHLDCIFKPQFKAEIGAWVRKQSK
jgi:pimeloyl-ACP methyl ester carboxylesterase